MDYVYSQGKDGRWKAGDTTSSIAHTTQGAKMLARGLKEGTVKVPTNTSEGACRGISLWWLIKRARGEDFWDWFGPPKAAAPRSGRVNGAAGEPVLVIKEVMQEQDRSIAFNSLVMSTSGLRLANMNNATKYVLARTTGHLALNNKRGIIQQQDTTWKLVANEVRAATGYCYMSFSVTGWGGHGMAAHIHQDGRVEFLDPNQGECDSEAADFPQFMDMVIGSSYPQNLSWFEMQTLSEPGQ